MDDVMEVSAMGRATTSRTLPAVAFDVRGSGPSVVMVSGLAAGRLVWSDLSRRLEDRFQVTLVDQRGFGTSVATAEPQTLELHAADVISVLDALEVRTASIVGISMGGGVAQVLALDHPERVNAVVLISASSEHSATTRDMFLSRAARAEAHGMESVASEMIDSWFSAGYRQSHPDVVAAVRAAILELDPAVFANRCRATAERALTHRLDAITAPVLFIGGGQDPMNAAEHLALYLAHLPRFEAWIGADVGHIVTLEAPGRVAALVTSFLGERALSG